VYDALRSNDDVWKSSMLVILYDEHGGLFDHDPPPPCVSPDGMACLAPPFDFRQLGVRVPAVVISPYIKPTTVDSTVYDHTSLLATAMKLFAKKGWPSDELGQRTKAAATLDGLLDLNANPRMDRPTFAAPAAAPRKDSPLSALQREAVVHASALEDRLPDHQQTGIDHTQIKTELEAGRYLSAVRAKLQGQR